MKLVIVSEIDVILKIDNENYQLNENQEKLELDLEEENTVDFFVYPIKEKSLPYAVKLEVKKDMLISLCQHIEIFQLAESVFEIRLKKFKLSSFNLKKVFSKNFSDYSLMVLQDESSLFVIKEKDEIFTFEIEKKFKEVAFDVKKNVPFFVASLGRGSFVCLFCPSTQKFFSFEAESVVFKDDGMELIENLNSHAGHGKKVFIRLVEERVDIEEDLLYLNNQPQVLSNIKVVPFAFFESVKVKDFMLAKTYLSKNLRNVLTDEVLQAYFGDFVRAVPYNYSAKQGSFVALHTAKSCKIFSFMFENGKIDDITLVKEYEIKVAKS